MSELFNDDLRVVLNRTKTIMQLQKKCVKQCDCNIALDTFETLMAYDIAIQCIETILERNLK